MIKTKKQMFIVIGVFTLVMMLGTVTYAFFNYTRTGVANNIQVGTINFNTVQGPAINLNNAFPIDTEEEGIMNDSTKVGTVTINVTGDTSYEKGIEYLVKAVNVENTINNKSVPISIDVSYVANGQGKSIGTEDEEYFDKRGGDTSYYKVLAEDTISDDSDILVGYIAPSSNGTGIDGNIVIKAYIDKANVAITDTYPEGDVTHTEGEEPNQETVVDYTNGTTSNWVGDRETFTTTEWNNLRQAGGISFQVRIEANEGTWVSDGSTDSACFTYTINNDEITIKDYNVECGGTDVVIPAKINNKRVVAISTGTFTGDKLYARYGRRLTSVVIPSTINTIGAGAFTYNSMNYVEINSKSFSSFEPMSFQSCGDNVTLRINSSNIVDYAFMLSNISSLYLGDNVRTIGTHSFNNNSNLLNVTIPNTVLSWYCDSFDNSVTIDNQSGVSCTS